MAVQQILGKLDALELDDPRAGVETTVQRHPDRPGLGEHCRILERGLDDRNDVQRVCFGRQVKYLDGGERERRERLVDGWKWGCG